jgi:hypothetical protein
MQGRANRLPLDWFLFRFGRFKIYFLSKKNSHPILNADFQELTQDVNLACFEFVLVVDFQKQSLTSNAKAFRNVAHLISGLINAFLE